MRQTFHEDVEIKLYIYYQLFLNETRRFSSYWTQSHIFQKHKKTRNKHLSGV